MERPPSRFWAFLLVLAAAAALAVPVWYVATHYHEWGPFGTLIGWITVCVSIFGILTVAVAFVRSFLVPAWHELQEEPPPGGNL